MRETLTPSLLPISAEMSNQYSSGDFLIAGLIFFTGVIWLYVFAGGTPAYTPDGATALHVAQNIATGDGIVVKIFSQENTVLEPTPTITKPPLYFLIVGALSWIGIEATFAGWAVSAAAWAAAVTLLFLLAKRALPAALAVLIPLLFALQLTNLRWGVSIHEQSLFVALCLAALWRLTELSVRSGRSPWAEYTLVGVLSALAMLTSYQGLPLLVVATAYVIILAGRKGGWSSVAAFASGVILIAAWPFVRFIRLWIAGIRPGFVVWEETTYYKMLAGVSSGFQNDVLGTLFVWLYDGSVLDIGLLSVFYLMLTAVALFSGWRRAELRPAAVFALVYLAMLIVRLGGTGVDSFEPRYNMPVYGLFFLFAVYAGSELFKRFNIVSSAATAVTITVTALFGYGQIGRYTQYQQFHGGLCPAPQTINWVKENIPRNSVIAAPQCGYRILAESNAHYWLPIPPAGDVRNMDRWSEQDFTLACAISNDLWIVLLKGEIDDPFRESPGYGPFVDGLFSGESTTSTEIVARLDDGLVYRLKCSQAKSKML